MADEKCEPIDEYAKGNSVKEPQVKSEGKIIKVQKEKGFGFIISKDHKFIKFFFHWTGLIQTTIPFEQLKEGMKVKFIPIMESADKEKHRGPRAIQIEVIQLTEEIK